jgi:hypothetical protein
VGFAIHMHMLMTTTDTGRATGDYRVCLFGGSTVDLTIAACSIIPRLPPHLTGVYIRINRRVEEISPPINRTSGPWIDMEDLVRENEVQLQDCHGQVIPHTQLLAFLATPPAAEGEHRGASIRWAVGVLPEGIPQLELQGMPARAAYLEKHQADDAPAVILGHCPIAVDLFQTDHAEGPIPLLFTRNKELTIQGIAANTDLLLDDISLVNGHLLATKDLPLAMALAYLQGLHTSARSGPAYTRGKAQGPAPMKQKPQPTALRASGRIYFPVN